MERLLYSPSRRADVVEHRYHSTRPTSPSALLTPSVGAKSAELLHRSNGTVGLQFRPALKSTRSFDDTNQFSGRTPLKMNEKEVLRGLNDRFSGFIHKVRHLESQNKELEREIEEIKQQTQSSASVSKEYDPELKELRKLVNEISLQKRHVELDYYNMEDEFHCIQLKYEHEIRTRSDAENTITVLKKYICDANSVKMGLDNKAQCLQDEMNFLKKNHEDEVAEMMAHIKEAQVTPEAVDFGKGDITSALRDIRIQLEGCTVSNIRDAEAGFRSQAAKLTKATEVSREALMATRQEISEHRRMLQSKSIEMDSAKGMREALEKQLYGLEEQHNAEINHYQSTVGQLEHELYSSKHEMAEHLQEYQDLLNVKMALDAEIFSYRKLLEGEECRYSIVTDTNISVPYIYRQSPVYTLPCIARHGGTTRRAEPQYKFVEEIITETTREDVEIDETESEETFGDEEVEKLSSEEEADVEAHSGEAEEGEAQEKPSEEASASTENGAHPEENNGETEAEPAASDETKQTQEKPSEEASASIENGTHHPEENNGETEAEPAASDETKQTQADEKHSQMDTMKGERDTEELQAPDTNGTSEGDKASKADVQTGDNPSQETKDAEQTTAPTDKKGDDSKKQLAFADEQKPVCEGLNDSQDESAGSYSLVSSNANAHAHSKIIHGKTTDSREGTPAKERGDAPKSLGGYAVGAKTKESEVITPIVQSASTDSPAPTENNKEEKLKALEQGAKAKSEVGTDVNASEGNTQQGGKALDDPTGERTPSVGTPQTESTEKASTKKSTETAKQESSQASDTGNKETTQKEGSQKGQPMTQSPEEKTDKVKPLEKSQTAEEVSKEQSKEMTSEGKQGQAGEEKPASKMDVDKINEAAENTKDEKDEKSSGTVKSA